MTTQYNSGNYQTNGLLSVPAPKEHIPYIINIFLDFGLKFKVPDPTVQRFSPYVT